jgi:uncharacterized protein
MSEYCTTTKTRLYRHPERAVTERAALDQILDEGLICHLGFLREGSPCVIPTVHARHDDVVYVHGSPASHMLRGLAGGLDACLTVTLIDGKVLSKSWFHHSLNYRSAVVFGRADVVEGDEAKTEALRRVVEHVEPGRTQQSRPPTQKELASTIVLALPLTEWSVKIRTGPPIEDPADEDLPWWNGVVPL